MSVTKEFFLNLYIFSDVSRKFKVCFKFKGCFDEVSRMFQEVLRAFTEHFKGILRMFKGFFKEVQGSFNMFSENFKGY